MKYITFFCAFILFCACDEELSEAEILEKILIDNQWELSENVIEIQSDCIGDTAIFGERNLDFKSNRALEFIRPNGIRVSSFGDIDAINWDYNNEQKEIALNTFKSGEEITRDIVFREVEISANLLRFIFYVPSSFSNPFCDDTEHRAIMKYKPIT